MGARAGGGLIGLVFGLTLCWSGMADPDVIRSALLFEDSYLFMMFAAAVGTATIGLLILRRLRSRARSLPFLRRTRNQTSSTSLPTTSAGRTSASTGARTSRRQILTSWRQAERS